MGRLAVFTILALVAVCFAAPPPSGDPTPSEDHPPSGQPAPTTEEDSGENHDHPPRTKRHYGGGLNSYGGGGGGGGGFTGHGGHGGHGGGHGVVPLTQSFSKSQASASSVSGSGAGGVLG